MAILELGRAAQEAFGAERAAELLALMNKVQAALVEALDADPYRGLGYYTGSGAAARQASYIARRRLVDAQHADVREWDRREALR